VVQKKKTNDPIMKKSKHVALTVLAVLVLGLTRADAQTQAVPTPDEVAQALGFTDAEIAQIKGGQIITKDLKEGSDKELAGVVGAFFTQPIADLTGLALDGKLMDSDPTILAHQVWKPDASADEAFTGIALVPNESSEAQFFLQSSAGGRLNLSAEEIDQFRKLKSPSGQAVNAVSAQLQAMLKARYQAYQQMGLAGIAPYARGGRNTASPSTELALAIHESLPGERVPGLRQALLNYPADPLPAMEHRFLWYKQTVENRPTFILADRSSLRAADAAVLTEEQFYVSHSYNSNFIIGGCFTVQGGTLVFYMNRTFTDLVAGFGSSLKHGIGRGQMLSAVAANLQRIRTQLQK
jgi:hypothetical protein